MPPPFELSPPPPMPNHRLKQGLAAGVVLLGLCAWFYHDSITSNPAFNHAWAQADWFALALKFRQGGYDFFHPATFNLLTDQGVTGAGFPVPAYLAALLMGLVGTDSPAVMRLVTLGFGLSGLLALFSLIRRASGSFWKGLAGAVFALVSPIYVFYQANFLPSVSAFGVVLLGYYCFVRALEATPTGREPAPRRWLAIGVGLMAAAAAMRTPFAVPLLASLGHLVVLRPRRPAAMLGRGWVAGCYGLAFAFVAGTLLYNAHLAAVYHGSMFLAQPLPFTSLDEARQISRNVFNAWAGSLLSPPQWGALATVVAVVLVQQGRRLGRWEWSGHWQLLLSGSCCYYVLMGKQYEVHDYYLIDTFLLPLVLLAAGSLVLLRRPPLRAVRVAGGLAGAGALLLAALAARSEQQNRITQAPDDAGRLTELNFRTSARWLDSLGVPRAATLLVLDARSYNLPLLLAQRSGWTVVNTAAHFLTDALQLPADYVVTQNFSYLTDIVYNYPLITERLQPVATNGHLTLWRLRPTAVVPQWQCFTDLESPDPAMWRNLPPAGQGPALSGSTAAWLRDSQTVGLTWYRTAAALGVGGGERLLMTARYQTEGDAQAQLVCSLEPAQGGPAYWHRSMPCQPTSSGSWWSVGGAFPLPRPRNPADVLKVYLAKAGAGAVAVDDVEIQLVR
ncbi:glycosyltransferase family 39 protein [Hymenobacter sp. UYCo722]|uniref:glycosyltransferase family 39 protein n=1 Tax=Hymenobacter sp. UYCo722 TaxID=3156335 RepID=UPI0033981FAD